MATKKNLYQRSKECVRLNDRTQGCLGCVFYDTAYSHCRAYETGYDKVKMALLKESLERVEKERDTGREHDATDDLPRFIEDQREVEVGSDHRGEPID